MNESSPQFVEKKCLCCGRIYKSESDYLNGTSRWRTCSQKNLWFTCSCGSTLILLKKHYCSFVPPGPVSSQAASIIAQLSAKQELPYLSTAIMEFQSLLSSGLETPAHLAVALKKDPVLAAEVLEIANNLKVPTGQKIGSLEHAIVYVGHKTLSEIVLVAGTKLLKFKTKHYSQEIFWQEAFVSAAIAESLGLRLNWKQNLDELFLAAALANIGKVVGAIAFPGEIDRIWRIVSTSNPEGQGRTWLQAETEIHGIGHRILGEIGAVTWGFPLSIIETAMDHHRLPLIGLGAEAPTILEIASFANQAAHRLLGHEWRIEKDVLKGYFYRFFRQESELRNFLDGVKAENAHLFKI